MVVNMHEVVMWFRRSDFCHHRRFHYTGIGFCAEVSTSLQIHDTLKETIEKITRTPVNRCEIPRGGAQQLGAFDDNATHRGAHMRV